jgi:hypothetical protein
MIKLTVIYNLPPDASHEEFLKWRTTDHQKDNVSVPGVIKTDFYIVKGAWDVDGLPFRYITEAYYPDMETFEKSFYDPEYQGKMKEWKKLLADPVYLISEEVSTTEIVKR